MEKAKLQQQLMDNAAELQRCPNSYALGDVITLGHSRFPMMRHALLWGAPGYSG
jgi:hypothetical protein